MSIQETKNIKFMKHGLLTMTLILRKLIILYGKEDFIKVINLVFKNYKSNELITNSYYQTIIS